MSVKRVVFIRPGETEWNKISRWQGIVAIPLNMHGITQAKRLAQFVRNIGLDVIYSSDLRRAKDTAAVLSEYTQVPFHYDERLRERDMGLWQGLTTNEIQDWYKVPYQELLADPHNVSVPKGESRAQVSARVNACFQDVVAKEGETIGIISHTTAIRTLLAELVPDSDPYNILFHNMSVTTIARDDNGTWSITQLDDMTHLEGMKSTVFSGKIG
ncbi:MAG: histidine phosphatase family protein [Phototrophicaceae bacterium]